MENIQSMPFLEIVPLLIAIAVTFGTTMFLLSYVNLSKGLPNREGESFALDFSKVDPYKTDFDISNEEPEPFYRQNYIRDYVYTVTMALQNLSFDNWVILDKNYASRMEFKRKIIEDHGIDAMDCRNGGYDGCQEMLEYFIEYLPRRFPTIFSLTPDHNTIHNHITGEYFDTKPPFSGCHPLYVAGRLVEDDLNILVEGPDGEYVLKAVFSAFPAGFRIQSKMDQTLSAIHVPVPLYKEKLSFSMDKFFHKVRPEKLVMRLNWSVNDHEELFLVAGAHLYEGDAKDCIMDEDIDISQVQLRVERQVLRRLPKSNAICMLTKTYLYPLTEISKEPGFAARLKGLLGKLPTEFAFYKRKPVWGKAVLNYLEEMAKKYPLSENDEEAQVITNVDLAIP